MDNFDVTKEQVSIVLVSYSKQLLWFCLHCVFLPQESNKVLTCSVESSKETSTFQSTVGHVSSPTRASTNSVNNQDLSSPEQSSVIPPSIASLPPKPSCFAQDDRRNTTSALITDNLDSLPVNQCAQPTNPAPTPTQQSQNQLAGTASLFCSAEAEFNDTNVIAPSCLTDSTPLNRKGHSDRTGSETSASEKDSNQNMTQTLEDKKESTPLHSQEKTVKDKKVMGMIGSSNKENEVLGTSLKSPALPDTICSSTSAIKGKPAEHHGLVPAVKTEPKSLETDLPTPPMFDLGDLESGGNSVAVRKDQPTAETKKVVEDWREMDLFDDGSSSDGQEEGLAQSVNRVQSLLRSQCFHRSLKRKHIEAEEKGWALSLRFPVCALHFLSMLAHLLTIRFLWKSIDGIILAFSTYHSASSIVSSYIMQSISQLKSGLLPGQ